MNKLLISFAALLFCSTSYAQPKPTTKIHRSQDTTRSESGWYYAKSTGGDFSVELPIPFNDFTVTSGSFKTYHVGAISKEGIRMSANKIPKQELNKRKTLDDMVSFFRKDWTVSDLKKEQYAKYNSISFLASNSFKGALLKYIDSGNSFYSLLIEFPIKYKDNSEELAEGFFSSLKILNE